MLIGKWASNFLAPTHPWGDFHHFYALWKVACYFQKNKSISEVEPKTEALGVLTDGLPRRDVRSLSFSALEISRSLLFWG